MRYLNLLFLLFSPIPYKKERTLQSLWESGKVPLLFAELFHFSIGLFHGFRPIYSAEEPFSMAVIHSLCTYHLAPSDFKI